MNGIRLFFRGQKGGVLSALPLFVVLGAVFHKRVLRASRETWRYSVLVGLSLVAIYLGATYGVLYTSVSNAGFIGAMTVLFTPFFEFVVYRKRPDRKLGFALAVCMAGMALLTLNEALRDAFDKHGVEMTYDHLNVHLVPESGKTEQQS